MLTKNGFKRKCWFPWEINHYVILWPVAVGVTLWEGWHDFCPHPIAVYTSSAQLHIQGVAHSLWQPSFCLFCKSVLSWRIKKYSWKNIPKNDNFLIILLNPLGVIPILYNTKYKISFWNIYVFCVLTEVETDLKQHKSENFHFFVNCTFKKNIIIFKKY